MKAIILAAGKATRLQPLTKDTPQSLLKIGNKTILEMQLSILNKCGIDDVVVVTGYLSDKIEDFAKGRKIKIRFNPFYSVSGILMSLWVAKEELRDGFIMLYSDILFEESIVKLLLNDKHDICLAIKKDCLREEAEKVCEKNNFITKIGKIDVDKPNAEFVGIAKLSKNGANLFIQEIEEIARKNLNLGFIDGIQAMIDRGIKVSSCDIGKAKFIDIDFEEDLQKAKNIFYNEV